MPKSARCLMSIDCASMFTDAYGKHLLNAAAKIPKFTMRFGSIDNYNPIGLRGCANERLRDIDGKNDRSLRPSRLDSKQTFVVSGVNARLPREHSADPMEWNQGFPSLAKWRAQLPMHGEYREQHLRVLQSSLFHRYQVRRQFAYPF